MSTNMAYRQYLVNNTDTIIKNTLNAAAGNCSNMLPLLGDKLPVAPVLFTSVEQNILPYDNSSDLRDNFLYKYQNTANASSSGVQYYQYQR